MIEIHTQRDGMWFTHTPKICYNNCNYGNSNIRCYSQVSVRIIYYLCITKKCNNVHGFIEKTNARRRGRFVWMRSLVAAPRNTRKQCNNVLADRGDFKMVLKKIAQCFQGGIMQFLNQHTSKYQKRSKHFVCTRLPGMPPVPPDYFQ